MMKLPLALCATIGLTSIALSTSAHAQSRCEIKDSPCYPWRIEAGQSDTTLLEVIPNNAITTATYRVCLCPPTKSVALVFDFKERVVNLGVVPDATAGPVCRDFRIQSARSSRLLIKRPDGSTGTIEGCYATF